MINLAQQFITASHNQHVAVIQPEKWFHLDIAGIATIFAVIVALFGERFWRWFEEPKLSPVEIVPTPQTHNGRVNTYQRLIVKNIGRRVAKEVRVFLTYENAPSGFIPIPLNWTHWNKSTRDISAGEPAYIDVLCRAGDGPNRFCWSHEAGTPSEPLLVEFDPDQGNLRIECFEHDSKIADIKLSFNERSLKIVPNNNLNY